MNSYDDWLFRQAEEYMQESEAECQTCKHKMTCLEKQRLGCELLCKTEKLENYEWEENGKELNKESK